MRRQQVLIEHVSPEMLKTTKEKFKAWDLVLENNLLESDSEDDLSYTYKLLEDPTIYFYAFFKDKKGNPLKLYYYQDLIINDNYKRVLFCAANQIGKSWTLCAKGLHYALHNPGKTVVMFSKTLPQSKDLLKTIKDFLLSSSLDYKYDIGDSETKTEIYFRHFEEIEVYDEELKKTFTKTVELAQSRIICVPATGSALGYAVDLMLIDELAFYDDGDYFYKQIAQPRTYTTKGQIVVFSNPNGQQGIFWNSWNSKVFNKYRFDFLDCPTNTQKEFDDLCEDLTQEEIDSTMLAVYTNPEGGFISVEERKAMQEERPNQLPFVVEDPLFIFFDFAKSRDRTVRSIGIPVVQGEKVGVHVFEALEYPQGTPYNEILDDLDDLIKKVGVDKIAFIGWDNTGVGRGIEDFMNRFSEIGITLVPVEFGLEKKSAMYTLLKLLVERNMRGEVGLKIPRIQECDKQFSMLRFKRTTKGYLQVHHEKEKDRDDFPDSLAGLCTLIIQPDNPPVSVTIVHEEGRKQQKLDDIDRCPDCQNIIDDWDERCSNCGKTVEE